MKTSAFSIGGGKRDRTADLLHAMQALSQLSYTPKLSCSIQCSWCCAEQEANYTVGRTFLQQVTVKKCFGQRRGADGRPVLSGKPDTCSGWQLKLPATF